MTSRSLVSQAEIAATLWRSELLSTFPGITHAVTRRIDGMGLADGNIGFSAPRDRADAWQMRQQWCAAAGLPAERIVTLGQVHGNVIHIATAQDAGRGAAPGSNQIGLGDALATNVPGPVLMTLHADCQALIFIDPGNATRGPAVAVAHAGWRGTVASVAAKTVQAMAMAFGSQPADLRVAVGPAIGACCYEVGDEVVAAWRAVAGDDADSALRWDSGRVSFSLHAANTLLLCQAGVPAAQIETCTVCTKCEAERWFSHRGQGATTGRFGAMITIQP